MLDDLGDLRVPLDHLADGGTDRLEPSGLVHDLGGSALVIELQRIGFDRIISAPRHFLAGELRDIRYNPQRHMPAGPLAGEVDALVRGKWELVASEADTGPRRREKFLEIRRLNGLLAEEIVDLARSTQSSLAETIKRVADDRVAFSREYSCFLVGAEAACEFYEELFAPLTG